MAAATTEKMNIPIKTESQMTKSQQKRYAKYQALGTKSKTRSDKRVMAISEMQDLSEFDRFCLTLATAEKRTLDPSDFLDYLAALVAVYTGSFQTVSIRRSTSNSHEQRLVVVGIDSLIPVMGPGDRMTYLPSDYSTRNVDTNEQDDEKREEMEVHSMTASYAFAALPDQRLMKQDSKCRPYVLDDNFQWTVLYGAGVYPTRLLDHQNNPRSVGHNINASAIISDGDAHTFCVYATNDFNEREDNGLYYNQQDEYGNPSTTPTQLLNCTVNGIFRQNDYLFVLCPGPKLYNVTLSENGEQILVNLVFGVKGYHRMFDLHKKFVGGYYDEEKKRLILASSNAMISVFDSNGRMNQKFDDSFRKWRKSQMTAYKHRFGRMERYEQGNLMYYDVDRKDVVYVGSQYVIRVPMDSKAKGSDFAQLCDIKSCLNIGYDVSHWMYIYHQGILVTLQKLHASAQRPFVLRIYTNDKLQFKE